MIIHQTKSTPDNCSSRGDNSSDEDDHERGTEEDEEDTEDDKQELGEEHGQSHGGDMVPSTSPPVGVNVEGALNTPMDNLEDNNA